MSEKEYLEGECYCGAVGFRVQVPKSLEEGEEVAPLYCVCQSCKRAHSSPIYQIIYMPSRFFSITRGEENITRFCKTPGKSIGRAFCSTCGSRVFNQHEDGPEEIGFFPCLLDNEDQGDLPEVFVPEFMAYPTERTFDADLFNKLHEEGLERVKARAAKEKETAEE